MNEFDDIRPYDDGEIAPALAELLSDRHFNAVMKGLAPWLPKGLRNGLLRMAAVGLKTPLQFQKRFMKPVVKLIMRRHTKGTTFQAEQLISALPNRTADEGRGLLFISNHRDIVLDSALLDVLLIDNGFPTTVEIGIGNNLLIYPWIEKLVRMNKAFIVKRGLPLRETMAASEHMSRYIHHAIAEKRDNVWIAQREGRAKDSSDNTQEAVLKMLALGGDLRELNIVPLTISYEYDPCDYLKAQEMQQKRDNPAHRKSKQDDLDNMKTGIFGDKGRVVYRAAEPVNSWLHEIEQLPRHDYYIELAKRIDQAIHRNYELYACNYVAADMLASSSSHADQYSEADKQQFVDYLESRIDMVNLPEKDHDFLMNCLLTMYANPVINHDKACQ